MNDEFRLRELKEIFPTPTAFTDFLREAITKNLPKMEWEKESVKKFIMGCRTEENGIPVFRTHFAKKDFRVDEKLAVLGVCWAGKVMPRTTSVIFTGIPEEKHEELKMAVGDWKRLIQEFGTEEERKRAFEAPVVRM